MKYADGQEMHIGDRIDLGGSMTGTLKILVDEKTSDHDFKAEEWSNLDSGILVESPEAGLIHYPTDMIDRLELIARRSKP